MDLKNFFWKQMKSKKLKYSSILLLVLLFNLIILPNFALNAKAINKEKVDYIFCNANILTLDEANLIAIEIAIKEGMIHDIGLTGEILEGYYTEEGNTINVTGDTIMPGIIDGHTHLLWSALYTGFKTLEEAQELALSHGYTTLIEKGADIWERDIQPLIDAELNDQLRVRVNIFPVYNLAFLDEENKTIIVESWYPGRSPILDHERMLRVPGIKIYSDGAGGGDRGLPAISIPYPQEELDLLKSTSTYGDLYFNQTELNPIVKNITDAGFRCAFHAMGDRAIETILNAIDYALDGETNDNYRHQIEHNSFLREDLITTVSELKTIHSVRGYYPTYYQDLYASAYNETFLEWNANRYSLPGLGVHAYLETDFTIENYVEGENSSSRNINPFLHLWGLVTRRAMDENGTIHHPDPWLAEHEINIDQALRMITIEGAYAVSQEDYLGTLEVGKFADLIIISDNPKKFDPDVIKDIKVYLTMVGGKIEYQETSKTYPVVPSPSQEPIITGPTLGVIIFSMILGVCIIFRRILIIKKGFA
jgi:predicted amidohydrolase YtcJ